MFLPQNRLLEKNNQAQRRNLRVQVPVVVPITPRLRLVEDERDFTSLGEVYERDRYSQGLDPDAPIMLYRERAGNVAKRVKQELAEAPPVVGPMQSQQQQEAAERRVQELKMREALNREKQVRAMP